MNTRNDDAEFEARLRQFQPGRPRELPEVRAPRRRSARMWTVAGAAAVGCLVALGVFRGDPIVMPPQGTDQTPPATSLNPAPRLLPLVEMTVYASTPPPLVGPGARVDASFPAGPSRGIISRVQPEYPPEAQQLGLEASLDLRITVDRDGQVTATERLSGGTSVYQDDPDSRARAEFVATNANAFWNAAEAAAREWKFEPAQTAMTCVISFSFRLTSANRVTGSSAGRIGASPSSAAGSVQPGLPPPSSVVRVGGDVRPPRVLLKVDPIYPEDAKAAGIQGVVLLEIRIAVDGSVSDARVLRSLPTLDQAAIDAVRQWKYEPTRIEGVPVEIEMNVYVNFTLS